MNKFNKLSRAEMRNVKGGTGDGSYRCTYWDACSENLGYYSCNGPTLNDCQDAADTLCFGSNCCGSVDCEPS